MAKPRLLLFDEPSMGLAPLTTMQIFEILVQLNTKYQTTIFLVKQIATLALCIAQRGFVLENGLLSLTAAHQRCVITP